MQSIKPHQAKAIIAQCLGQIDTVVDYQDGKFTRAADKVFLEGLVEHRKRGLSYNEVQCKRLDATRNRIARAADGKPKLKRERDADTVFDGGRLRDKQTDHARGLKDQQKWFLADLVCDRSLSNYDKCVLGYLYFSSYQMRDYIDRSISEIVAWVQCSKSTASRSLDKLEAKGYFRREVLPGGRTRFWELLSRAEQRWVGPKAEPQAEKPGIAASQRGSAQGGTLTPFSVPSKAEPLSPFSVPSKAEPPSRENQEEKNHEGRAARVGRAASLRDFSPLSLRSGSGVGPGAEAEAGSAADSEGDGGYRAERGGTPSASVSDADPDADVGPGGKQGSHNDRGAASPSRRNGSPRGWVGFFERYYSDPDFAWEGEALVDQQPHEFDRTYCYGVIADEIGMNELVVIASVNRFRKWVKDKPFPGLEAAKQDVHQWLRREKQKGRSNGRFDPDNAAYSKAGQGEWGE